MRRGYGKRDMGKGLRRDMRRYGQRGMMKALKRGICD